MALIKASVTRVVRNPKNKQGAIVTLSNGHVLWLQLSYITALLEGAFMDDCRPTALVGTEVSYEMKSYKAGDLVFDRKGEITAGQTVKFTTTGERPINLTIGDIAGHVSDYDRAQMQANAFAKASVKASASFASAKAKVAAAGDEEEEEEEEDELPAAPARKSAKVK